MGVVDAKRYVKLLQTIERTKSVKRLYSFLSMLVLILFIVACSQSDASQFIEDLKPTHSKYKIHLFYSDNESGETDTTELNAIINSDQEIANAFSEFAGHDLTSENVKKLKSIDIDYFPVYLIVDKEGIKLKTQYLSKVKQFIELNR